MSQFGFTFDNEFKPFNNEKYKTIVDIYNNPELTKTKEENGNSTYMTSTVCMLINECRYLIAIVKNDTNLIGTKKKLDEIEWDNFQTRTLKGKFDCSVYDKSINRNIRIGLKLLNRNEDYTQYISNDNNFKVSLLHTKKNNLYEYPNEGDVLSALEMYQTVVTLNE